jgi:uncharacterized protein YyaL (SSP411 family)
MPNALVSETSPYLLQHADNPVDWLPWSDAAFARATGEDKPVLLSIGYSACHWCHVMAHESFEDPATAGVMNELFVNIKVDREERPDVDRVYQVAHQLLTQRGGGWPLTMFLDPESRRPFFGGTYFPRDARYGLPAFAELLKTVAHYFSERRDDVREQGRKLVDFMGRLEASAAPDAAALDAAPLAAARANLGQVFDAEAGGFGAAPKFPHPANVDRLLRHWRSTAYREEPDLEALYMATFSLSRMADGCIYDHLGGGFCRYAVDRHWQIPHFEKMLYDNGPLLALYAQAYLATGDERYAEVARETAAWLAADMRAPNGGFFSTRDADSEGEEGRYYVWTPPEAEALLDPDEYAAFSRRFGLDAPANFEGHWHLSIRRPVADVAEDIRRSPDAVANLLAAGRSKLLAARATRVPPARDEKQLCAWNALAIRGFAIAGRALDDDDLVAVADGAVSFIESHLWRDGRLFAVHTEGLSRFAGYLDDYAFLIDALLELLQARWSSDRLRLATDLADCLLGHFEDRRSGGFWFTADDGEPLMHRPKPMADEALPSGNGVAALALQRLGFLLGETRYLDAAERTLRAAWPAISEFPQAHVSLLNALDEYLDPPEIVVLRGPIEEIERWRRSAARLYAPRRFVFAVPDDAPDLPGALAERRADPGRALAWRCIGTRCDLPLDSWEALAAQMSGN